ncbi:hypothetical protein FRB99_008741 [Tulasnella sp. 403]|nr:hypothetical protein FRB99_008741 [Tulasnella sp. 403]
MSEPLRLPLSAHGLGMNGLGTAKRKLDVFDEGLGQEEAKAVPKKTKAATGTKKRAANGIPKGFRIQPLSASLNTSDSSAPEQASTSQIPTSPPPNRHPIAFANPDDRPLPAPKAIPREPVDVIMTDQPTKRAKAPAGRASSKPPSRQAGEASLPLAGRGKGKNTINDSSTAEELARLSELEGEIGIIEAGHLSDTARQKDAKTSRTVIKHPPIQPVVSNRRPATTSSSKTSKSASVSKRHPSPPPLVSRPNRGSDSSISSADPQYGLHASTSTVPLPLDNTPMIERNRAMRQKQTGRRKSNINQRSARVSESLDAGILASPHPSVEPPEFYTHISADLPEALRIRQLLVWCSNRAVSVLASSSDSNLPHLSSSQQGLLNEIQEDFMKMLCLGKVDTSLLSDDEPAEGARHRRRLREHPRNVINRAQEAEYIKQEEAATAEETAWSALVQSLNNRQANVVAALEKEADMRKALEDEFKAQMERKRKGKEKAEGDVTEGPDDEAEAWLMSKMWDIPTDAFAGASDARFSESVRLVETELALRDGGVDSDERRLVDRISQLEPRVDEIYAGAHAAQVLATQSKAHLSAFSKALALRFKSRIPAPLHFSVPADSSAPAASITSLVRPTMSSLVPDTMMDLRLLSAVKVNSIEGGKSDAARRAAMELERGVAERRLTAIPATPRRTPRKSASRNVK